MGGGLLRAQNSMCLLSVVFLWVEIWVHMGWKMLLDVVRFILVEYEPVASRYDPFHAT